MATDFIERRTLLQELAFVDIGHENRQKVQELVTRLNGVDLLGRDEGKEPVLEEGASLVHCSYTDGTGGFENRPHFDWKCPVCGWFVGELYCGFGKWHIQGETTFCAKCGQKIDWSKPKEEEKRRYEDQKAQEREEFQKKHGLKLDNMNEGRRRKYGMLEEGSAE